MYLPLGAPAEQDQRSDAQYEGDGDTDRPRGDRAVPIERFMDSQKNEGEPNVGIGGAREGGRIVYRLPRNGAVDSLNEPGWVYRPLEPQNAIACTFVTFASSVPMAVAGRLAISDGESLKGADAP